MKLFKSVKNKSYRRGYNDYLHSALENSVFKSHHDYLTASYVAHQLYIDWQTTNHLDTTTPFATTVKLFENDKSYAKGAKAAFEDVWKYLFIFGDLYDNRDAKDAF